MASTLIVRRGPPAWYFVSETDRSESQHRVDLLGGSLYCTCAGFLYRKWCGHLDQIRSEMEENGMALAVTTPSTDIQVWRSPEEMRRRMADLLEERSLVQQFFREVMIPSDGDKADGDYGIVPGTDKPTLFKAGAEKLCELYGFAIEIADVQEFKDDFAGHYRAVVRVTLLNRTTGAKVADGIGECNSRESRYAYRWVFDNQVPEGLNKANLKQRSGTGRNGRPYTLYRVENDELHSLWNTILKMAKKRALVDATLSATRSSGIFSQGADHLDEWLEADYEVIDDEPEPPAAAPRQQAQSRQPRPEPTQQEQPAAPKPSQPKTPAGTEEGAISSFWASVRLAKLDVAEVKKLSQERFEGREPMHLTPAERAVFLSDLTTSKKEPEAPPAAVLPHDHEQATGHNEPIFTPEGEFICAVCKAPFLDAVPA